MKTSTTAAIIAIAAVAVIASAFVILNDGPDGPTDDGLKDTFSVGDFYMYDSAGYDDKFQTVTVITEVLPDGLYGYVCSDKDFLGGGIVDRAYLKDYLSDIDPDYEYKYTETIDTFMGEVECRVYTGLIVDGEWTDRVDVYVSVSNGIRYKEVYSDPVTGEETCVNTLVGTSMLNCSEPAGPVDPSLPTPGIEGEVPSDLVPKVLKDTLSVGDYVSYYEKVTDAAGVREVEVVMTIKEVVGDKVRMLIDDGLDPYMTEVAPEEIFNMIRDTEFYDFMAKSKTKATETAMGEMMLTEYVYFENYLDDAGNTVNDRRQAWVDPNGVIVGGKNSIPGYEMVFWLTGTSLLVPQTA